MKRIQKAFLYSVGYSLQVFASQAEQTAPTSPVSNSWYSKMLLCWESLGTNIQLAIQLCLLLIVFYALSSLFQCKKKAGCATSCNCGCAESCTCKPENGEEMNNSAEDTSKKDSMHEKSEATASSIEQPVEPAKSQAVPEQPKQEEPVQDHKPSEKLPETSEVSEEKTDDKSDSVNAVKPADDLIEESTPKKDDHSDQDPEKKQ